MEAMRLPAHQFHLIKLGSTHSQFKNVVTESFAEALPEIRTRNHPKTDGAGSVVRSTVPRAASNLI
jgi:hypothetical protein